MTFLHSHLPLDLQLLVARSSFDLSLREDLLGSQKDTLARHNVAVDSNDFIFTEHDELNLSTIGIKQVVRLPAFKSSATPSIFATSREHGTLVSTTHNATNSVTNAEVQGTEQTEVETEVAVTVEVGGGGNEPFAVVLAIVEVSGTDVAMAIVS